MTEREMLVIDVTPEERQRIETRARQRAVYKDGQLRPLEPLDLTEGQTVNLTITTELTNEEIVARMRAAGILVEIELDEDVEELTPEERDRIGRLFIGARPSEELIDEDRGLY